MPDFVAQDIKRAGDWSGSFELCVMTYDERFLRRKVVKTAHDDDLLLDQYILLHQYRCTILANKYTIHCHT